MARGGKKRVIAATKKVVGDSLVSSSDKEPIACGGKNLCSSDVGGRKEKKIAVLKGGSQKSGSEVSRRNKMKDFFADLRTFLPHLPSKIGKAELAEETANYIKHLEHECQALEKRKEERTRRTDSYRKLPIGATFSDGGPEHCTSREAFLADQFSTVPLQTRAGAPDQQQCFTMYTCASPNVVLSVAGPDAHVSVCAPKTPGLISATVHFLEKHGAEVLSVQICSDTSRTMFVIHAQVLELDGSVPAEERFKLAKKELILWLGSS